jgi:hypothetical protein
MVRLYGCAADPPSRKGVSHSEPRTVAHSRRLKSPPPRAAMNRAHSRRPPRPASRYLQPSPAGTASFQTRSWIGREGPHPSTAAIHRRREAPPNRGGTRIQNGHVAARVVTHPATDVFGAAMAWHPGPSSSPCRALSFCGRGPSPPPFPDEANRIRGKAAAIPGRGKPDPEKTAWTLGQGKPDPGKDRRDSRTRQTGSGEKPPGSRARQTGSGKNRRDSRARQTGSGKNRRGECQ